MIRAMRPALLFALVLGLAAAGCGRTSGDARPSVVLVLIDQLRADAATSWLSETRALSEHGVRFEEMRSVAPWTYPAVISLLSGLYPQQHGADGNREGGLLTVFSEDVPLLPRTLRAAGYHTAGFVANPFLHEWNPVHEAFDHYDASFIGNQGPTRGHGDLVWTARMYADSLNAAVRAWFDAHPPSGPEFVYVHYMDVHGRAAGPERWKEAPFEERVRGLPEEAGYETAVRYVDGKVRELYDYFSKRHDGALVFVVTSDHGQDLGDDLTLGEGRPWRQRKASLHDFNLRVPCWILPGGPVPSGVVVSEPCTSVDLVPTLLDWLGLAPTPDAPGTSLLGALRGEPYDGHARAFFARNSAFGRVEEALVHADHKLVRYSEPVRRRVAFDLAGDPRETHPLMQIGAEEEALLERCADPGVHRYPAVLGQPPPDLRQNLEALGYGGAAEGGENAEKSGDRPR